MISNTPITILHKKRREWSMSDHITVNEDDVYFCYDIIDIDEVCAFQTHVSSIGEQGLQVEPITHIYIKKNNVKKEIPELTREDIVIVGKISEDVWNQNIYEDSEISGMLIADSDNPTVKDALISRIPIASLPGLGGGGIIIMNDLSFGGGGIMDGDDTSASTTYAASTEKQQAKALEKIRRTGLSVLSVKSFAKRFYGTKKMHHYDIIAQ